MTLVELYFVLSALQLIHGTEEYLTGWSERSKDLYVWYRKFLPFVSPNGMSVKFHVILNFTLGWVFLAVALFVVREEAWAIAFARAIAVIQIVHTLGVHILAWALFRPYFPGAVSSVVMLIVAIMLLLAPVS